MYRALILATLLTVSATSAYAKSCKDPATGKFVPCHAAAAPAASAAPATAAPAATTSAMAATTTGTKPHCTKGVPCGNACIAKGKVCHKT